MRVKNCLNFDVELFLDQMTQILKISLLTLSILFYYPMFEVVGGKKGLTFDFTCYKVPQSCKAVPQIQYLNHVKLFLKYKVTWELSRAYITVRNFILD